MGSADPSFYLKWCDACDEVHPTPHRDAERKKAAKTRMSDLPQSNHPWIMVRLGGVTIFANEEWCPFVLGPDDMLVPLQAHLPKMIEVT